MRVTEIPPTPPQPTIRIELTREEASELFAILGQGSGLVNDLYYDLNEFIDEDMFNAETRVGFLKVTKKGDK